MLRQTEIPVEHAVSFPLPTLRWGKPAFASFASPLRGHTGRVMAVAFSPDGNMIASSGQDGTVILWAVATGSTDGAILLWDPIAGKIIDEPLAGDPTGVLGLTFSPDGEARDKVYLAVLMYNDVILAT